MSLDPMNPDPNGATGNQDAASNGQGGDFDYQRGYNELRPEFTRATQELSQSREALTEYEQLFAALSDPSTQAEALEALGLELAPDGSTQVQADPNEFVDPLEADLRAVQAELNELKSARQQDVSAKEQAELEDMRDDYIGQYLGYLEGETKQTFSEREEEVLGNLAIAMTNEQGLPDVQGAFDRIYGSDGVLEARRSQWIDSKRGAAAAPLGSTIPAEQKPQTASQRVAYIDERMRAIEQQQ